VGETKGELDGLIVVDASTNLAGAYCAKLLADAGATVTLVEPSSGATLRRWTCDRELDPGEDGALFRYLRHGQRSVTTGHRDGEGVREVLDAADVVVVSRGSPIDGAHALTARRDDGHVLANAGSASNAVRSATA